MQHIRYLGGEVTALRKQVVALQKQLMKRPFQAALNGHVPSDALETWKRKMNGTIETISK